MIVSVCPFSSDISPLKPKSDRTISLPHHPEWLLIDLALSSIGCPSLAPTRLNLVSPILENGYTADVIFADVSILESILEQVAELGNHFPIVIVGRNTVQKAEASRNTGFNVFALEELETLGKEEGPDEVPPVERSEFLVLYVQGRRKLSLCGRKESDRLFTTSFFEEVNGVSTLHLFPKPNRSLDPLHRSLLAFVSPTR